MQRNPSSCLSVFMRTSSLARSCLRFHHSSARCSSIGCLHGFSYLLSTESNQLPQQSLQEARLSSNSRKVCTFSHPHQLPGGLFAVKNLASSHIHYDHHCFSPYSFSRKFFKLAEPIQKIEFNDHHSQRALTTALWCNFFVFSLKFVVWLSTSSHVMFAEVVHSLAGFANQAFLARGLSRSRRPPDDLRRNGNPREEFLLYLGVLAGIFCVGSTETILRGFHNLWTSLPPNNIQYAALLIGGALIIKGGSLVVAIQAVKKNAAAEGMKLKDYIWLGRDPNSAAVMIEDVAAVTGLVIAGGSLVAVHMTGNAIYDAIGCILVGKLLGMVAIFLVQMNGFVFIGRAMSNNDMERVLRFLQNDLTSIDFRVTLSSIKLTLEEKIKTGSWLKYGQFNVFQDVNKEVLVQNYLNRIGVSKWTRQMLEVADKDEGAFRKIIDSFDEKVLEVVVTSRQMEIESLKKEIQELVPGIRRVDIRARNLT